MCTIIAKKLPDHGWVIAKNRDRNYKPDISIKQRNNDGIQRLYMHDDKTRYTEGVNEYGVAILSASVMVKKDEKEGAASDDQSSRQFYSPDGIRIRTALKKRSAKTALQELIRLQIPGNTLVADDKECYILEGAFKDYNNPNKREYKHQFKKLRDSDMIVRTNHGVFLPWSGYQNDGNKKEADSRKSSETRFKHVEKKLESIKTPEDMMQVLSYHGESDPQMNPLRLDETRKAMRTTGQLMIVPRDRTLHYRPVYSNITLNNFNKLNDMNNKTFFEVISSRKLVSNDQ